MSSNHKTTSSRWFCTSGIHECKTSEAPGTRGMPHAQKAQIHRTEWYLMVSAPTQPRDSSPENGTYLSCCGAHAKEEGGWLMVLCEGIEHGVV